MLQKIPLAWWLSPSTESSRWSHCQPPPRTSSHLSRSQELSQGPPIQLVEISIEAVWWMAFPPQFMVVASGKVLKVFPSRYCAYRCSLSQSTDPWADGHWANAHEGEWARGFCVPLILPLHLWKGPLLLYNPQAVPSMESVSSYGMQISHCKQQRNWEKLGPDSSL